MQPFSLSATNKSVNLLLETTVDIMESMVGFCQNRASEAFSFIFVHHARFCIAMRQTQTL